MSEVYLERAADYLQLELGLIKERRPAYSMRAFARDLSMSPSSFTDFLKGRHGVSEARARAIAKQLQWSQNQYEHFWNLVQAQFATNSAQKAAAAKKVKIRLSQKNKRLDTDAFKLISEWQHLAILTFLQMKKEGASVRDIMKTLSFDEETIEKSLQRMRRVKIVKQKKGAWIALTSALHTGDEVPSEAVRLFHSQILDEAKKAIQTKSFEERTQVSYVYSIEQKYMPQIGREIRDSIEQILQSYSQRSQDDCIQILTLQMFPVTSKIK